MSLTSVAKLVAVKSMLNDKIARNSNLMKTFGYLFLPLWLSHIDSSTAVFSLLFASKLLALFHKMRHSALCGRNRMHT